MRETALRHVVETMYGVLGVEIEGESPVRWRIDVASKEHADAVQCFLELEGYETSVSATDPLVICITVE